MNALIAYSINENNFVLSPERTIFWEKQNTLIIADLHIGRQAHPRKKGKAVPKNYYKEDIQRLFTQILYTKAGQLIIVGDLSLSRKDQEMEIFKRWRNDFSSLTIRLVNGNQDILHHNRYDEMNITSCDQFVLDNFSFCHNPEDIKINTTVNNPYTFSGHVHPGIQIKGMGRGSIPFPCFYFKNSYAMLPAFSRFKGISKVDPEKGENVFAIVDNGLLQVQ
ncbi:MAG TPA: ligase-associated DNA damage response endonuclease PdeM [Chitinophagaceae bacterium]|nr:ligase-associated DNA damage response endonuclease PdeM [Chitinophagaceae bacterium]